MYGAGVAAAILLVVTFLPLLCPYIAFEATSQRTNDCSARLRRVRDAVAPLVLYTQQRMYSLLRSCYNNVKVCFPLCFAWYAYLIKYFHIYKSACRCTLCLMIALGVIEGHTNMEWESERARGRRKRGRGKTYKERTQLVQNFRFSNDTQLKYYVVISTSNQRTFILIYSLALAQ